MKKGLRVFALCIVTGFTVIFSALLFGGKAYAAEDGFILTVNPFYSNTVNKDGKSLEGFDSFIYYSFYEAKDVIVKKSEEGLTFTLPAYSGKTEGGSHILYVDVPEITFVGSSFIFDENTRKYVAEFKADCKEDGICVRKYGDGANTMVYVLKDYSLILTASQAEFGKNFNASSVHSHYEEESYYEKGISNVLKKSGTAYYMMHGFTVTDYYAGEKIIPKIFGDYEIGAVGRFIKENSTNIRHIHRDGTLGERFEEYTTDYVKIRKVLGITCILVAAGGVLSLIVGLCIRIHRAFPGEKKKREEK